MIGKPLLAHIEGDFRKIRVFREDGAEYGVLAASGCWSMSFHTRETRKEILQLNRDRLLVWGQNDPVIAFSNYVAQRATRNSHKKKQKITREAGLLANALYEQPEPVFRYKVEAEIEPEEPRIETRNRSSVFGVKPEVSQ